MKLQDQLNAYKQRFLEQAPEDVAALMKRSTQRLADSGILDTACQVGALAPHFSLQRTNAEAVDLAELISRGPLVLSFYRGKW